LFTEPGTETADYLESSLSAASVFASYGFLAEASSFFASAFGLALAAGFAAALY
jgi:hypothetical protein